MTAPRHDSPIDRVLGLLSGVRAAGSGRWMAKCPAHDDKQASLSIRVGSDARVVMFCHANCSTPSIVAAIGLAMTDLFAAGSRPLAVTSAPSAPAQGVTTRARMVKSWDYTDADGTLLFQVCRMEPKAFPQRRRVGNDWKWGLGDLQPVLYRLPQVIEAANAERRIFFVEGEKDADTLADLGFTATTSPMGAGKWREPYADVLAGTDVVILPDNDEPGLAHGQQVAASLTAKGCKVRVVTLPGLPPKGDISDWLSAGNDLDALERLIGETPRWTAAALNGERRTRWLLSDIWENDSIMRPPPPVVPYLAWTARTTLLAAREKSGKSTLTGFISAQVSRGADFLGEPCARGKVLIIGLEEFIGDTARRLKAFGADGNMIELVNAFAGAPDDRPSEVRAHIEAVGPVLVILDSLMAYAQGVITDANNSTQTQATVQGLTTVAHDTGAALVIIHHARKSDGKYRDSSAIGGSVDIIAEVFPPDEAADPTRRRVRPVGRVPAREVDFRFTGLTYTLADSAGPLKPPLDQRIDTVVRERPGISANSVVEAVHESRDRVLERIKLMLVNGSLVNDGDSRFMKLRSPTFRPGSSLL